MLKKTLCLLTPKEKFRGILLMGMVTIMAVMETAGVASVVPFLSVLGNPEIIETNPGLAWAYEVMGFESVDTFLMALGAAAFGVIIFSSGFRILTHFAMNHFIEMRGCALSERLLETYLRQPYSFFLDRHSGDLAKNILSEVNQLIINVFRPGMLMLAYTVVIISITTLLFIFDPVLAAGVIVVIGGLYFLIYFSLRGMLDRAGKQRHRANRERFTAAGEALGGIKDIKLLGRENAYLARFHGPAVRHAKNQATNLTLSQTPQFIIQAVAFGGVIALVLVLLALQGDLAGGALDEILPVLGLYAFAGYKIMPAAQHVYRGMSNLRFGMAAVDGIYEDLHHRTALAEIRVKAPSPLIPEHTIALERLSYTYPNVVFPALKDIDLVIPVGTSLGVVGYTGAGKTTLVDVLLGLLRPTQGAISVDGESVTDDNLRAWQQALGYVPQDIFLTDSTVTENIALGVPPERIDRAQVERCARMAQVHDFIFEELAKGYDTLVGERGVRLSGGQRQRIGIARALYHDPQVLVFDEATSALDTVTERAVMHAINELTKLKTIIIIAHRLSTVQRCDKLVLLEKGQIKASGSFEELNARDVNFRSMTAVPGSDSF